MIYLTSLWYYVVYIILIVMIVLVYAMCCAILDHKYGKSSEELNGN